MPKSKKLPRPELVDVRFVRLEGSMEPDAEPEFSRIEADAGDISFRFGNDNSHVQSRYAFTVRAFDEDDAERMAITVEVMLEFVNGLEEGEPFDVDQAREMLQNAGGRIALPYIREAVDSLSVRMGGPKIQLGMAIAGRREPLHVFSGADTFVNLEELPISVDS